MQKISYIDLHCDTLTECFDGGYSVKDCNLQINLKKLNESGCAAQCFAIFTQGAGAARRFRQYLDFFKSELSANAANVAEDIYGNISSGQPCAILTVENLGFLKDLSEVDALAAAGVKMASLVWNYENQFAYPNLYMSACPPSAQGGGIEEKFTSENKLPRFLIERESRGLKPLGRQAVARLDENKIIIDISHLSDGGAKEILSGRKIPLVASHSNAAEVCNASRNLTDSQIKKIADCGGVVGVNFCKDFLGEGDTLACVLRHVQHIIKVGGEDVIAIGSDYDGIPAPPGLEDCTRVPALLNYLKEGGIPERVLEKLSYKNFLRVFKEVCG